MKYLVILDFMSLLILLVNFNKILIELPQFKTLNHKFIPYILRCRSKLSASNYFNDSFGTCIVFENANGSFNDIYLTSGKYLNVRFAFIKCR